MYFSPREVFIASNFLVLECEMLKRWYGIAVGSMGHCVPTVTVARAKGVTRIESLLYTTYGYVSYAVILTE